MKYIGYVDVYESGKTKVRACHHARDSCTPTSQLAAKSVQDTTAITAPTYPDRAVATKPGAPMKRVPTILNGRRACNIAQCKDDGGVVGVVGEGRRRVMAVTVTVIKIIIIIIIGIGLDDATVAAGATAPIVVNVNHDVVASTSRSTASQVDESTRDETHSGKRAQHDARTSHRHTHHWCGITKHRAQRPTRNGEADQGDRNTGLCNEWLHTMGFAMTRGYQCSNRPITHERAAPPASKTNLLHHELVRPLPPNLQFRETHQGTS
jgi:hypothetical protein